VPVTASHSVFAMASAGPSADAVEALLKSKIYFKYGDLHGAFRAFDRSHNGAITLADLRETLKMIFGVEMNETELHKLRDHMDANHDGVIGWSDFVAMLDSTAAKVEPGDSLSPSRVRSEADSMLMLIKTKIDEHFSSLREAFLSIDRDRTGQISRRDFEEVVLNRLLNDQQGVLDNDMREALFRKYDLNTDGVIHYEEFMKVMGSSSEYGLHLDRAFVKGKQV